MWGTSFKNFGRLLTVTTVVAAIGLFGAGFAAADYEAPRVFSASQTPNCISVNWELPLTGGSGVNGFSVEREQPPARWDPIPASQWNHFACGMEPGTYYRFEVCAYYTTDEGDFECGHADLRTADPQPAPGNQRPPAPRIVELPHGETWIGVKWDAGYDFDSYNVQWTLKRMPMPGPVQIHHDDDGTWGYQRIDGLLPSRTYILRVQGCNDAVFGILGDNCYDWSPPAEITTLAYPLHSGPDTCAPGFVWREAFDGDTVCVTPQRRDAVKADNARAWDRREFVCTPEMLKTQSCPFTAPDTCKQFIELLGNRIPSGYVWREARPSDHVCVTKEERDLIQHENATAWERYARPR